MSFFLQKPLFTGGSLNPPARRYPTPPARLRSSQMRGRPLSDHPSYLHANMPSLGCCFYLESPYLCSSKFLPHAILLNNNPMSSCTLAYAYCPLVRTKGPSPGHPCPLLHSQYSRPALVTWHDAFFHACRNSSVPGGEGREGGPWSLAGLSNHQAVTSTLGTR